MLYLNKQTQYLFYCEQHLFKIGVELLKFGLEVYDGFSNNSTMETFAHQLQIPSSPSQKHLIFYDKANKNTRNKG